MKTLRFFLTISVVTMFCNGFLSAQTTPAPKPIPDFDDIKPDVNQKLDELKQELNNGQIKNEEELTAKMYNIIYGIEEKMNTLPPAEVMSEDMDNEMMHAHDSTDMPEVNKVPMKRKKFSINSFFKLGFATAMENGTNPTDAPEINFWRSAMMEIGLKFRNGLNSSGSFGLNYGITYMYLDFDTKSQLLMYNGSKDKVVFGKLNNVKDSDFGADYICIPLGLDFKISRKLKMDVGAYAGILLNGFTNLEQKTELDERVLSSSYARYNMNSFIYGAKLGFGFKNVGIYAQYNLNSMLKDTYNLNPFSVGLQFNF